MKMLNRKQGGFGMIDKWHVFPINDLRDHSIENGADCWCKPYEDEEGVIIHNSMDGREDYETGKRLLS